MECYKLSCEYLENTLEIHITIETHIVLTEEGKMRESFLAVYSSVLFTVAASAEDDRKNKNE